MSEKKEINYNATLDNVYADLKMTVIFLCGAWILFWLGTAIITGTGAYGNAFIKLIGYLLFLGSFFVAGGPVALTFFATRSFKQMFVADYEVITTTTYGDGRTTTSSDGGLQSMASNTFVAIIVAIFFIIVGLVVQLIRLIIQITKYIYYYAKVNAKPAFKNSGFLLIIISMAVFIGAPIVTFTPIVIREAKNDKQFAMVSNFKESLYVKGSTLITRFDETSSKIRENPDQRSNILTNVPLGVHLTIIDDPVNDDGWYYFPVEYQGFKGWIVDAYVEVILGTATTISEINYDIPAGVTVNIISYSPPTTRTLNHYYLIEYNGSLASIDADANLIQVSPELKSALGVVR